MDQHWFPLDQKDKAGKQRAWGLVVYRDDETQGIAGTIVMVVDPGNKPGVVFVPHKLMRVKKSA